MSSIKDYYKFETEFAGIYVTKNEDDEFLINVADHNQEDALIVLNSDEFEELVNRLKKMI